MQRLFAIIAVTLALAAGIYFYPHQKAAPTAVRAGGKPQRIVCLAPSLTETVFALGAGDRVVGVTKWCDYPPEAKQRTVVGGMGLPNLEVLVKLQPDLILAPSSGKTEDYERLRQLGYRVEVAKPETSLRAVHNEILDVGRWIGEGAAAEEVARRLDTELSALDRRIEEARIQTLVPGRAIGGSRTPHMSGVPTVFVVGHDPLFVAGSQTFAAELLSHAGALNICWDVQGWSQYGMESLLTGQPEVILDSTGETEAVEEYWRRWPTLPAVKSRRVYAVDANITNRPGPRVLQALDLISKLILQPAAFSRAAGGK